MDPPGDRGVGAVAQHGDQADDRVPAVLGGNRERFAVLRAYQVAEAGGGALGRRQPRSRERGQPHRFHRDHRVQHCLIGHDARGALVARPQ